MNNKKDKVNKLIAALKLMLLFGIIIAIPLYLFVFQKDMMKSFKSLDDVTAFLNAHRSKTVLLYIGIQVAQIVISVIPGQFFQIGAGYLFGFPKTLVFSVIGAFIGTFISFYLAKILGRESIKVLFKNHKIDNYLDHLNSQKGYTIVFLIYLIPGFPKDIVGYIGGLSNMNFKAFVLFSLLGRTPAMSISILVGTLYYSKNYTALAVVITVVIVITGICILKRKKISGYIERLYKKVSK